MGFSRADFLADAHLRAILKRAGAFQEIRGRSDILTSEDLHLRNPMQLPDHGMSLEV